MGNNITEVVFILDASGSMESLTADTIGGFNSMLKEQKEKDGTVLVSTVTFNSTSHVVHDRVNINDVPLMTENEYRARGNTALIDALGDAIHHIENIHKYIRKEDVPENTLFIITTDGMENSSHKYTSADVKKKVEEKKQTGWEFLFVGANIDAVETAARYGIERDMVAEYLSDKQGTAKMYNAMSFAVNAKRRGEVLDRQWKADIEKDTENRK